jgi:hypothetical protein
MQQLREREEDIEKSSAQNTHFYRYHIREFWLHRILSISFLCLSPFILWWATVSTNKLLSIILNIISMFIYLFSTPVIIDWHKKRSEERWMREHKDEVFIIDEEGISWEGDGETVWMRWEEISYAYIKDNIGVLGGAEEKEIRFWNANACLRDVKEKYDFFSHKALSTLIAERCPLLKSHPWEMKDEETMRPKSPRVAYKVSGAQVFSYHTYINRFYVTARVIFLLFVSFFMSACLFAISEILHLLSPINFLLSIIPIIGVGILGFSWWNWYRQSQIETDDLGIAFVEPKGIKWQVQWFTIASYRSENQEGIITTKDGKTYKFPRKTARADELDQEIRQRIEKNQP